MYIQHIHNVDLLFLAMFCVTTNVLCYLTAHLLRTQILRKQQMWRDALLWQTTRPITRSSTLSASDGDDSRLLYPSGLVVNRTPLDRQMVPVPQMLWTIRPTTERTDDYTRDPGVSFDGGFYLVASAAFLSVIACAIVLLSRAFPRVVSRSSGSSSRASVAAAAATAAVRSRPASASTSAAPSTSTASNSSAGSSSASSRVTQEERSTPASRVTRLRIFRSLFRGRRANAARANTAAPDAVDLENDEPPPYADDNDQELLLASEPTAPPTRDAHVPLSPMLQLLDAPLEAHREASSFASRSGNSSGSSVPLDAGQVMQTADDVPLLDDVGVGDGSDSSGEQQPPSTAPMLSVSAAASTSVSHMSSSTGSNNGFGGSASSLVTMSSSSSRPRAVRFASPLVALQQEEAVAGASSGWRSAARPGRPALRALTSPPDPRAGAAPSALLQPQPDSPPPDYSP